MYCTKASVAMGPLFMLFTLGACASPVEAPAARPSVEPSVVASVPRPAPAPLRFSRPANLDEAYNLRGAEGRMMGFEVPMGARPDGQGRALRIATTLPRLLRFYRSRAYLLKKEGVRWVIRHSSLSVDRVRDASAGAQAADTETFGAVIYLVGQPGGSFLLRFDDRRPASPVTPPLLRVLAAEGRGLGADHRMTKEAPRLGPVPVAKGQALHYERRQPRSLERFTLHQARRRALQSVGVPGTSRGVSGRIHAWSKQGKGRAFLD